MTNDTFWAFAALVAIFVTSFVLHSVTVFGIAAYILIDNFTEIKAENAVAFVVITVSVGYFALLKASDSSAQSRRLFKFVYSAGYLLIFRNLDDFTRAYLLWPLFHTIFRYLGQMGTFSKAITISQSYAVPDNSTWISSSRVPSISLDEKSGRAPYRRGNEILNHIRRYTSEYTPSMPPSIPLVISRFSVNIMSACSPCRVPMVRQAEGVLQRTYLSMKTKPHFKELCKGFKYQKEHLALEVARFVYLFPRDSLFTEPMDIISTRLVEGSARLKSFYPSYNMQDTATFGWGTPIHELYMHLLGHYQTIIQSEHRDLNDFIKLVFEFSQLLGLQPVNYMDLPIISNPLLLNGCMPPPDGHTYQLSTHVPTRPTDLQPHFSQPSAPSPHYCPSPIDIYVPSFEDILLTQQTAAPGAVTAKSHESRMAHSTTAPSRAPNVGATRLDSIDWNMGWTDLVGLNMAKLGLSEGTLKTISCDAELQLKSAPGDRKLEDIIQELETVRKGFKKAIVLLRLQLLSSKKGSIVFEILGFFESLLEMVGNYAGAGGHKSDRWQHLSEKKAAKEFAGAFRIFYQEIYNGRTGDDADLFERVKTVYGRELWKALKAHVKQINEYFPETQEADLKC